MQPMTAPRYFVDKYRESLPKTIYYDGWEHVACILPNVNTLNFIKKYIPTPCDDTIIAEIGIGVGATTHQIATYMNNRGKLLIFDFHDTVIPVKKMMEAEGYTNVMPLGCSYKRLDSYNWNLLDLIKNANGRKLFDYVYLDGAHSFPVDALAFFLIDILLKPGGYIEFDDYAWTHGNHIRGSYSKYLDSHEDANLHSFLHTTMDNFTQQQIDLKQVALIVDILVRQNVRYTEIETNRLFKKLCD